MQRKQKKIIIIYGRRGKTEQPGHLKKIGVFIDWIETPYHTSLVSGITGMAEKLGRNTLIFVGGNINSPLEWERPRNVIYDIPGKEILAGLIIVTGSSGVYCTPKEIKKFCDSYKHLPRISIGESVEGVPSVLLNNRTGFRELLLHMIDNHKYRKIAFIKGPENNRDARERFTTYKETLEERGIPFDPLLVEEGDFNHESGARAAVNLIEKKKLFPQAIAAADDDMAVGALNALKSMGINVPGKIAVTGFDNQEFYKYMTPSLSTVQQPIEQMGETAAELLENLINGQDIPPQTFLDSIIMIRESCGDHGENTLEEGELPEKRTKPPANELAAEIHTKIITLLKNNFQSHTEILSLKDIEKLTGSFFKTLEKRNIREFMNDLESLLNKLNTLTTYGPLWNRIFTLCRKKFIGSLVTDREIRRAEELLDRARVFISKYIEKSYMATSVITERATRIFLALSEQTVSNMTIKNFLDLLTENLPEINISSFYISLFQNSPLKKRNSSASRLIFAYRKGKKLPLPLEGILYPSSYILPEELPGPSPSRGTMIVEPLFFKNDNLGFAVFELAESDNYITNIIRRAFMLNTLRAMLFIHQLQNQSDKILQMNQDLESRVVRRTADLNKTNDELKITLEELRVTQEELIESEKLAAMGSLVAGMAHEINTPVGIALTSASHLDIKTDDLMEKFDTGQMKKSDLEQFFTAAKEANNLLLSNLNRSVNLINRFKELAAQGNLEKTEVINFKEFLEKIICRMEVKIINENHRIHLECAPSLEWETYPGALSRVISHLILNSYIHAFEKDITGTIQIKVFKEKNSLIIHYSDDGRGIEEKFLKKIYDPFFKTSRQKGGVGLGLHQVYNIVNKTLEGKIKCENSRKGGVSFIITLP